MFYLRGNVKTNMLRVGIIGASGYAGGELIRLLLFHPEVELKTVVSREYAGEYVFRVHSNLRNISSLKFVPLDIPMLSETCDLIFTATPHGASVNFISDLLDSGLKIIDLSADFRLKNAEDYEKWYGWQHSHPELLKEAVYGLPELHRDEIRGSRLIACPGCSAAAAILGLTPIVKAGLIEENRIIIDVKIGSSGAGTKPTRASHHPERSGGVRPYSLVAHRHTTEIEQELNNFSDEPIIVSFSPHAVNMVRGILCTTHTFTKRPMQTPEIWKIFRSAYKDEPFVRIVKDRKGLYQLPDPKIVIGSNFCDVGFELDTHINRIVILSALDNLLKGAAGQAVQCMNIMLDLDERKGLEATGFHPM